MIDKGVATVDLDSGFIESYWEEPQRRADRICDRELAD